MKIFLKPAIFYNYFSGILGLVPLAVVRAASLPNPLNIGSIPDLLVAMAGFVFAIAVPVSILMFVYAGFLFMTSSGSPEKIKKAKEVLLFAVLGLGLAILAESLVLVIKSFLLGSGGGGGGGARGR